MGDRARAYALTDKAIRYLNTFGHTYVVAPMQAAKRRREKPSTAPGLPMPRGLCPVCGNAATVLLDGGMGLHSRGPADSRWCRGYGREPMKGAS